MRFPEDCCGTFGIMGRVGKSKPAVWRWQKRFMKEGVEGLTHDKPFAWTADPDKIIEKVNRGKQALKSIR